MISCIVVDQNKSTEKYNEVLFSPFFYGDLIEINEDENGITSIFIYKVEKIKVWQTVLNLETDQIPVGFGFGEQKDVAKREALDRLNVISEMSNY